MTSLHTPLKNNAFPQRVAPDLTVSALRSREDLEGVAAAWSALEASAPGSIVFQGLGWSRAVFDFEKARQNNAFTPLILCLWDGTKLVAVLPLEQVRSSMRTLLAPLGTHFCQIADVILACGYDPKTALQALLDKAKQELACDTIDFLKVRTGSQLALGMPDSAVHTGEELGVPIANFEKFQSYSEYFQTIRAKTRKNIRNARNRLEREAPLSHRLVTAPEERIALIRRTLAGRADRLKEQGLSSRAFADTAFTDFCTALVGHDDIVLQAFSLRHGDHPMAEQWGFVHQGRYYAFVATRDFSHSDESPGKLHLAEVTRACHDLGLKACDLGIPVMPYKMTWANQVIEVKDYLIPITLRGRASVYLWDKSLRPFLKAMLLRAPVWLRSALMRTRIPNR